MVFMPYMERLGVASHCSALPQGYMVELKSRKGVWLGMDRGVPPSSLALCTIEQGLVQTLPTQ